MLSYDEYKQILELWEQGNPKTEIARITGVSRYTVRTCIQRYKSVAELEAMITPQPSILTNPSENGSIRVSATRQFTPRKRRYTDQKLQEAVAQSKSYAQVLRQLGIVPAGGNYETIKKRIKTLSLDVSHFTGKGWLKGKRNPRIRKQAMSDILVRNSTYGSSARLRNRLITEGYFDHRCAGCGLTQWQEHPIPLELHHMNGDRHDNRIENLRLLCPNCHALTPTYRGKNINGFSA